MMFVKASRSAVGDGTVREDVARAGT